ncbi:two-component system sensor histidine kinase YcbA [Lachnospiraceae bacterium PF1-21]|uniref:histidine kinase n=1 Tax=Ohessyouella blattaphilus TaxID=2949333 RepID=A0ABT1ELG0_9FIRM|nr:sensor histidine kinase [Ohessyouella blattaphilus]MCP1111534.1 sensor histidine kinase [Ohessyouella blattaphilus]MCR8564928.1 sensor histidine kinase [Ohessyouella blattaphilus]
MNKKLSRTLLLSFIAILAGQLNISFYTSEFRISLAIVFILVVFFIMDSFYISLLMFLSGLGVYLTRVLVAYTQRNYGGNSWEVAFPELCFYTLFTLLIWIYNRWYYPQVKERPLAPFLPLVVIDYSSNVLELLLRFGRESFTLERQFGIFLIAFLRIFLIWLLVQLFVHYRSLLMRQEHEDRYKRLLIFISRLNEELVWLRKNTEMIENTMSTSYLLYDHLREQGFAKEYTEMALDISRDVHEIKKEYLLILRGLEVVLESENNMDDEGMYLLDMLSLLRDSVGRIADAGNTRMDVIVECEENFYTTKHYLLLSVFRNLMINSLEAAKKKSVQIVIKGERRGEYYWFKVSDNGNGISEEALPGIFLPGFSTKINYETGEVGRGLGLSLVSNMINKDFGGVIEVESSERGTTFEFTLKTSEV